LEHVDHDRLAALLSRIRAGRFDIARHLQQLASGSYVRPVVGLRTDVTMTHLPTHPGRLGDAGTDWLLATVQRYAARPDDWPLAPRFNPRHRWCSRIAKEPETEIWLLSWLPGQHTDLHDHGGSAGAFVVVSGMLSEVHVTVAQDGTSCFDAHTLPAGHGHSFGTEHIHRITNAGSRPAVSVHAYSPELQTMRRYRVDDGQLVLNAVDQAGDDW
jgi:Cysteine dioxygenase type I